MPRPECVMMRASKSPPSGKIVKVWENELRAHSRLAGNRGRTLRRGQSVHPEDRGSAAKKQPQRRGRGSSSGRRPFPERPGTSGIRGRPNFPATTNNSDYSSARSSVSVGLDFIEVSVPDRGARGFQFHSLQVSANLHRPATPLRDDSTALSRFCGCPILSSKLTTEGRSSDTM